MAKWAFKAEPRMRPPRHWLSACPIDVQQPMAEALIDEASRAAQP